MVGLLGAIGAVIFRLMIRTVQALAFYGTQGLETLVEEGLLAEASDPLASAQHLAWYWRIAVPAAGGAIVGPLVYFFAREARGHGVPEVMKAVALRGGVIRPRIVAIKSLASAISIGTGGSVGREGPIVQIGSAIGSAIGQLLGVPTRQLRTFVGCGAAAGISATFNAPIAGALFAAEVIVGDFAVAQFSPIVISSVVATVVSRAVLGNHPAFPVPPYEIVTPWEIAPYMLAGAVAGVVAVVFIRAIGFAEDAFERVPGPEWPKAALGGALVGTMAIGLPQLYGVGYTTIGAALEGQIPALLLGTLLLSKIIATSITVGSGGSGGVFAPSLFLGAMTGGFLGSYIHAWFPEATASSGAYALVTMGAVVAAATQAPISAIIIIFELTQTINIIPALMVACVLSSLVSQLLSEDSVYTSKLKRQGIDLFKREDPNPLKALYVSQVVDEEPEVLPADAGFQQMPLDLRRFTLRFGENLHAFAVRLGPDPRRELLAFAAIARGDLLALGAHPGEDAAAVLLGEVDPLDPEPDDLHAVLRPRCLRTGSANLIGDLVQPQRIRVDRDQGAELVTPQDLAELGDHDVAEIGLRVGAISDRLQEATWIGDLP